MKSDKSGEALHKRDRRIRTSRPAPEGHGAHGRAAGRHGTGRAAPLLRGPRGVESSYMLSHRSGLAVAAVTCILFIVPSLAQATDFCVNDDPCVQGGGTMLGTFEDALQAAEA